MTWGNARRDAEHLIAALAPDLRGRTMRLPEFADQASYRAIMGHGWTFEYHHQVMRALARLLKQRGAKVEFVEIGMQ